MKDILGKELTLNQIWVIQELRRQNCHFLAEATERNWRAGEFAFIDDRVNVKGIRRKFKQGNKETII